MRPTLDVIAALFDSLDPGFQTLFADAPGRRDNPDCHARLQARRFDKLLHLFLIERIFRPCEPSELNIATFIPSGSPAISASLLPSFDHTGFSSSPPFDFKAP